MKELGIILFIFISLIILSLGIDFFLTKGDLQEIIITAVNPFRVMDIPEMVIMIMFVLRYFLEKAKELLKQFKKDGNGIGKVNREGN